MVTTKKLAAGNRARPGVVIDRAYMDRLEALASGASRRVPAMAERLQEELGRARVVASSKMPPNVVSIGNICTYRDETTGLEKTVSLVFPGEADISLGRISVLTPIGAALLGLSEGASFWWDTRQGQARRLTVTRVGTRAAPEKAPASVDDLVDEASEASFPASDPPGWTLGYSRLAADRRDDFPAE